MRHLILIALAALACSPAALASAPRPDGFGGTPAHVTVPYAVTFKDSLAGRWWRCSYPITGPRQCQQLPPIFRMYDAQPIQWTWAKQAQQHVPLPTVSVTLENGSPQYDPASLNPGNTVNWLSLPFDTPRNTAQGWTVLSEQGDFLHELGHAYDYANMTPARRAAFMQIAETTCAWWAKHCITGRWVSGPGVTVDIPPGEMFAEEYAACALGLTQRAYQDAGFNTYGWVPPEDNPGADAQLCALIRAG